MFPICALAPKVTFSRPAAPLNAFSPIIALSPIVKDFNCNTRLLNPRALMIFEYIEELKQMGVSCIRLEFNDENIEECKDIIDAYYGNDVELDSRKFTYGYFKEKEDE